MQYFNSQKHVFVLLPVCMWSAELLLTYKNLLDKNIASPIYCFIQGGKIHLVFFPIQWLVELEIYSLCCSEVKKAPALLAVRHSIV